MITHVLIPTDFSPTADAATRWGVALAARLGARVTLLNVYSSGVVALPDAVYAPTEEELRALEDKATAELREVCARLSRPGLALDCVAVAGLPSDEIVAVARQRGADLIVMGTHGRRGVSHLLLGSVAERVVRTAPCPVLTVGHHATHAAEAA